MAISLRSRIDDTAVALKKDVERVVNGARAADSVQKTRSARAARQVKHQEIILKQLREERDALLRVYETALDTCDGDLNEESFWGRVAQVDAEIAAATSLVDAYKIAVHLPVESGSLFVGGSSGVYFGVEHVWLDRLEADLTASISCLRASQDASNPPQMQMRLAPVTLSLLLQGVKIKTDKGKRIPDMDIKSLHLEACIEAVVPLVFRPHVTVQQYLDGAAAPSPAAARAATAAQDTTGAAVSGRFGRWCIADAFKFSVSHLKTRQVGGGMFALPSGVTQWIVNMLLPGAVKKAALDLAPPELGDMLCLGEQGADFSVHIAATGIPRSVAAAGLGAAAASAELPPVPPLVEACLPPPLLPHQDGPMSRRRMEQILYGVADEEAVPDALLQQVQRRCRQQPCTPLTQWAGMPPVGNGQQSSVHGNCMEPNGLLSCGAGVEDAAQQAATAAYWLGMTPLQAQHWSATFQHSKLASLNLCSMHGIIDFARAHRPWLLQLLPDIEEALLSEGGGGVAQAAAGAMATYPRRLAQGIMQWVALVKSCQGLLDDQLQLGVLSAGSAHDGEDQLQRTQATQGIAQASAVDARIVFMRALAVAGLPVAVQCTVQSLQVHAKLLHTVRLAHQVALRSLQEQQAAVLKQHTKKRSVMRGALTTKDLAELDHARMQQPLAQLAAKDVSSPKKQADGPGKDQSTSLFGKAKNRMQSLRGRGSVQPQAAVDTATPAAPAAAATPVATGQPLDDSSNPFAYAHAAGTTALESTGPVYRSVALAAHEGDTASPAAGGALALMAASPTPGSPAPRDRTVSCSSATSNPPSPAHSTSDRQEIVNLQRSVDALHAGTQEVLYALQKLPLLLKQASSMLRLDILGGGLASSNQGGTVEAQLEHLQAELAGGGQFARQVLDQAISSQASMQSRVRNNHSAQRIEVDVLLPQPDAAADSAADSPDAPAPLVAATVALQQLWMGLLLDTAAMAANGCIGGIVNIAEMSFLGPLAPGFGMPGQAPPVQRPQQAVLSAATCPWLYPALDVKRAGVHIFLREIITYLLQAMLCQRRGDSGDSSPHTAAGADGALDSSDESIAAGGPMEQVLVLAEKYLQQSAVSVRSHLAVSLKVGERGGRGQHDSAPEQCSESASVSGAAGLPDFTGVKQDTSVSLAGSASDHARRMRSAHLFKPIPQLRATADEAESGAFVRSASATQGRALARGWGREGSSSPVASAAGTSSTPPSHPVVGAHVRVNLFALAADLDSLSRP